MKKLLLLLSGIVCIVVVVYLSFDIKKDRALNNYRYVVNSINNIESIEFEDIIKDETKDLYIFFGRETCPYCIEFLEKKSVRDFFSKNNVCYLNTENTDKNELLKSIRKQYDIEFVPSLLHVKKGNAKKINIDNL